MWDAHVCAIYDAMSDVISTLSEREVAELCAFADGTLPPERVKEVEARVAASPELLELVERQRQAVVTTRTLSADRPPESRGPPEGLVKRAGPAVRYVECSTPDGFSRDARHAS